MHESAGGLAEQADRGDGGYGAIPEFEPGVSPPRLIGKALDFDLETSVRAHNQRCVECKTAVQQLLARVAGRVEVNYDVDAPARLEGYKTSVHHPTLKRIYEALQGYRDRCQFVRARRLPRVDYYLQDWKMVVEFDEAQHFTALRAIALENYPADLALGFSRARWLDLCVRLHQHDDDPPYRDEQRAWYDTLRDFYGTIRGNRPTVRLFAADCAWCTMSAAREDDVEHFRKLLSLDAV